MIARISGYGQDGPYRDKPAFGAIGEAMGGLRHLTAHPAGTTELPPPRCGISISDDLAGLYAAIGLLAALWQRDAAEQTGRGRVIDVNLVDSVFSLMEGMLPEYALDGRVRQPVGAAIATAAPTNTYRCADGKWLCVAGNSDLIFRAADDGDRPAGAGRGPALRHQRRPLRPARRTGRGDRRLDAGGDQPARQRPRWRRPTSPVRACTTSPTARRPAFPGAPAVLQAIDDPLIGPTLHPGPTIRLDGDAPESVVAWTGPAVGAHTEYVLHTLLGLPAKPGA